jgi:hypothetical protein
MPVSVQQFWGEADADKNWAASYKKNIICGNSRYKNRLTA